MHGPSTSPPLEAPPIVAPPVVAPLPAEEARRSSSSSSIFDRILRDIRIGGVCLIFGLLLGQSSWLRPDPTLTTTIAQSADLTQRVAFESPRRTSMQDLDPTGRTAAQDPNQTVMVPSVFASASPATEADPFEDSGVPLRSSDTETPNAADVAAEPESIPFETDTAHTADGVPSSIDTPTEGESELAPETVDETPLVADYGPVSLESLVSQPPTLITPAKCEAETCQEKMESLGTSVMWADTPADAYRLAGEQDKLVFLIHVSGNFEIPGFT